ncbi:MAG: 5-dehydro-2-deoxygluconokinase [Gaiellales bacterium]|nr:5-dehydro-2-deoxygluconokinase [Gaiellales bacterium]
MREDHLSVSLELVTVGRVSVDLYAREQGVGFAEVETFAKSIGGSPTNVAVAAARLGRRAAVITAVGDDPFGEYVRGALADRFGVDVRFVGTHPTLRTPLAFAAMNPPEEPQLLFYREPDAPDMQIELSGIDRAAVREAEILWVSASALSAEPSRATTLALMGDRDRTATILDLDYRPTFWHDEAEASAVIGGALALAGKAVGNREECRVAVGTGDPHSAADALLARGCELAVVKQGGEGVLVATPGEREVVPGLRVKVVCGLGAGDAFGGALCHGLLSGWAPAECVRFANAAGAIVASRLLCADAMPEDGEVRALLTEAIT